jgi:hypothetical protein
LPIAMMAGVLDTIDLDRIEAAPIQGFLKKPVELKDLADRVRLLAETPVQPPIEPPVEPPQVEPQFATIPSMKVPAFPEVRLEDEDLLILTASDLYEPAEEPTVEEIPEPVFSVQEDLELEELDLGRVADAEPELPAIVALTEPTPETLPTPTELTSEFEETPVPDADLSNAFEVVAQETGFELPEPEIAPQEAHILNDWADESESLLSDLESSLPPMSASEAEGSAEDIHEHLDAEVDEDIFSEELDETLASPSLELGMGAALMAGVVASSQSEPDAFEYPASSNAVAFDAESLVRAVADDPALAEQLAKALLPHLPVAVLKEVAWEVLPEMADRLKTI